MPGAPLHASGRTEVRLLATSPSARSDRESHNLRIMASISSVKTEDLETECVPKVASIKVFVEQQWYKATEMLQSNPNLMTGGIFSLALKHRPPVHIVQFMLQLNPKAASIPDIGPTPLQIAVKHGCSAAVVRTVVEACPFALVCSSVHLLSLILNTSH